jgi:IclR family transcriptional regulator, pca regulon regulatory protein
MDQPLFPLPASDPAEQPDFVTALARGLAVIRAFGTQSKRMSLAEIARRVELPRATVRRSLITLETLGYVETDGKTFMLTPQVLSLGHSYLMSMPVTRAVRPYLERMSALLNEGSSASILDHDDAVFVARVPVRRVLLATAPVGSRVPAYCTSTGRVLLAAQSDDMIEEYLARIEPHAYTPRTITDRAKIRDAIFEARAVSYSIVEEELDAGAVAISVPIKDAHDRTVAALSVVSHIDRATGEQMVDRFLPHMRDAVKELRSQLV